MTATDAATGMTEVECTMCHWTQPAGRHTTHGTAERPIGADYIDAVMPRIGAHIDETGHPVRVTITTYWPDGDDEHSSMTIRSRRGTDNETRTYQVGDAVTVPDDFCPGCMDRIGKGITGVITGHEATSLLENDGIPGPYYTVAIDHEHNGTDGDLVYAESELAPATDHDWVAALERHETQLGCVTCGCTEPESGWQDRVSSPREGWLCGPCNLLWPSTHQDDETDAVLARLADDLGATPAEHEPGSAPAPNPRRTAQ
jgi:hypothetical protein